MSASDVDSSYSVIQIKKMWSAIVIYIMLGIRFEELDWNKEKFWEGTDQTLDFFDFLLIPDK